MASTDLNSSLSDYGIPSAVIAPAAGQEAPAQVQVPPSDNPNPRVTRPATTRVWGTEFSNVDMPEAIELADRIIENRRPEYFVTANLNYLMLVDQYPRLTEINENAAGVFADGHPIVVRSRFSESPLPSRVTGADMIVELAGLSSERGYSIYFLGAAPGVADAASRSLQERFPNLQIAGTYSPPYRQLNAAEHAEMIERINASKPDILLVAFGQPKGECWIYDNLQDLKVPLSIQLGASFDFLAGTSRRAPKIWQRFGCEWLYRALSDPFRLAPRYAANAWFLARKLFQ